MRAYRRIEQLTDSERKRLRWLVRAGYALALLAIALGIFVIEGTITGPWPAVTFSTYAAVMLSMMGIAQLTLRRARSREDS